MAGMRKREQADEHQRPSSEREARLGQALRDNLLRRKAQQRGRAAARRSGAGDAAPPRDGEAGQ